MFCRQVLKVDTKKLSDRFRLLEEPSSLDIHHCFLLFTIVATSPCPCLCWRTGTTCCCWRRWWGRSRSRTGWTTRTPSSSPRTSACWTLPGIVCIRATICHPRPPQPHYHHHHRHHCSYHRCHHDHNHHYCCDLKSFFQPVYSSRRWFLISESSFSPSWSLPGQWPSHARGNSIQNLKKWPSNGCWKRVSLFSRTFYMTMLIAYVKVAEDS